MIWLLTIVSASLRAEPAQTALSEVASVPFGSTREQTLELLNKRFGMTMPPSLQKPSELYFTGGEFAGSVVDSWWFRFATNKLYEVHLTLDTKDPFATLDQLAGLMAQKYGAPTAGERSYSFPYNIPFRALDDAKIKQAFKEDKARFYSVWRLTNGTIYCHVSLSGGGEPRLYLTYTHSEFSKNRSEETKSDL